MCGLAGIIAWNERLAATPQALAEMTARVAHRGPDDRGQWSVAAAAGQAAAGLVHCRLAVLDLDPRSRQPMHSADGRRHLVFNGEIYNFRELREELSGLLPGFAWRTSGDSEVILAAVEAWGEKCVEHFNGMFALAIWDQQQQSLLLARDRMGQKPLYFALDADVVGAIAFGSELPAVLAAPWVRREISMEALEDYLAWGYVPSPATIYKMVQSLPPGCCMEVVGGAWRSWRYFDPNASGESAVAAGRDDGARSAGDPAAATRRLVQQAVRRQLVSDVPIGCLLSGGIDSSCIAAAMRGILPAEQVRTFTISFADPRYDESAYAARVAAHLGTRHQCFRAEPHIVDDLPRLCAVFGQPFADSSLLPTHYLSRYTRQEVTVALGGDGGDELFGGYDRYRAMALPQHLPRWMRRGLCSGLWQKLPGVHPKSRLTRLKRFCASLHLPAAERYADYMRLFPQAWIESLLRPESRPAGAEPDYLPRLFEALSQELVAGGGPRSMAQVAMAVDRVSYLPEDLLAKVDRASMLHALEVRSPLMDHELVEFAAGLTERQLLMGGKKPLLRAAFGRDLPAEVFTRPKMGFALPIGDWLRGELRPMLDDLLGAHDSFASQYLQAPALRRLREEHDAGRADHSQRLYALLVLELWWRQQG